MTEQRTVRGVELSFDWVDAGKELIVFLHGVGADHCTWISQVTYFSQLGYSVASVDMRGSGKSQCRTADGLAVPITIHDFAADIDALIQELGFSRAHWVGNSMGGVIIQEALVAGFDSLDRVVLCNTFAAHPDARYILPRPGAALKEKSLLEFARDRIPLAYRPDISPAILKDGIRAMADKDVETYLMSWRETWSQDYRSRLKQVAINALVITGELDRLTPPALGQELAHLIPHAQYQMIKGASHISNQDQPEIFNQIVYDFLRS